MGRVGSKSYSGKTKMPYKNLKDAKKHNKRYRAEHADQIKEYNKRYRAEHKEERKEQKKKYNLEHPDKRRNYKLKHYGINVEKYNKLFEQQKGCCAICGQHQSELDRKLAVDHNHKTGKIRGLLCSQCNMGLGIIENINFRKRSLAYLGAFLLGE